MRELIVLAADDEAQARKFLAAVIAREKLPVARLLEADNGLDAVALSREHRPDLAFLDVRMPGMDGLSATRALLAEGVCGAVVIVSAYGEFDYAQKALRAGAADYLLKPVKPAELARIIRKCAGTKQPDDNAPPDPARPRQAPKHAVVRAVLDHMAANIGASLRIADIARAVHVSPWHLSRTFKRLTGSTMADCLLEMRISRARDLLLTTDLPVTDLALRLGFANSGYFATRFRQATGQSPLQYRKNRGK